MEKIAEFDFRTYLVHGEAMRRNLDHYKRKKFVHRYLIDDFARGPLIRTAGKSIFLHGKSNTGKTYFAVAHFQNPLLVSDIDQLKRFDPAFHDGLVFDDMSFRHVPPEAVIHLVDQDFDRNIRCRHYNAFIPANTAKIFVHNDDNIFFDTNGKFPPSAEQKIAIARRLDCYRVLWPLFKVNPTALETSSILDKEVDVYHCDGQ